MKKLRWAWTPIVGAALIAPGDGAPITWDPVASQVFLKWTGKTEPEVC